MALHKHLCERCNPVKLMQQESSIVAKKIINRIDRNLGRRLREARREMGLTTREACKRLPRRLSISHSTLASYENGVTAPAVDVLAALADAYHRTLNWFLDSGTTIRGFRYRNLKPRVPLTDRLQFEASVGKWAEAYLSLERHLQDANIKRKSPPDSPHLVSPAQLATIVRKTILQMDDDQPIQNMVYVLESFSAWALEIHAGFDLDGAAANFGDDAVVVFNPDIPNHRMRMTAAHELAHVLYCDCKTSLGWTDAVIEDKAYGFATSLLMPPSQLERAFEGKSFLKLIQYKERFGVSLSAMIHMAAKTRLINTTASRWLLREMVQRGWKEREPGYVWRDRAVTFETMLECAIQSKKLDWSNAERITGITKLELQKRIADALEVAGQVPEQEVSQNLILGFAPLSIAR
jgi:Zn-dependent peptidase ImmA (M78 family)/DNA-binding XRE family transcriptional regulator